jgi:hypothetical protein
MCISIEDNSLRDLDFLGGRIGYKINGKSSHKIPFGGFLTLILILIFSYYSYFIILPFIQRNIPRIAFQNYKEISPPEFKLKYNNILFAFNISLAGVDNIKDYLNITATYNSFEKNFQNNQVRMIDFETVNNTELGSLYEDLNLMSAQKFVIDDKMVLEGSRQGPYFSFIKFYISLYNTSEEYMQKVETILENGGSLQFLYSDFSLEIVDYDKPLNNFISYHSDDFNFYDSKSSLLEFSINKIWLDQGYLFDVLPDALTKLLHYNTLSNYSVRLDKNLNLYTITIQLTKVRTNVIRSYMKVPELLSVLGGSLILAIFFFYFLNDYVNDKILCLKLIENLYEIDSGIKKFEKVEKKILKRFAACEITGLKPISRNKSFENNYPESAREKIKKEKNYHKVRIHIQDKPFFSKCDVCFNLFLCCFIYGKKKTDKWFLFSKAKKHIDNYIDIRKVTKKFIEIDFLKYLILNEEQMTVSKLIGKPFLTFNDRVLSHTNFMDSYLNFSEELFHSDMEMKNFKEDVKKEINNAYQKLVTKESLSTIDKKLLHSCENNLDLVELE